MNVTLALAADYANTTAEGKLNILGVFTEIHAPQLPFVLPQMYLVVSYQIGAADLVKEKQIDITLRDSAHDDIVQIAGKMTLSEEMSLKDENFVNQVLSFASLRFPQAGDYEFVISVDGERKGAVKLHVYERPEGYTHVA